MKISKTTTIFPLIIFFPFHISQINNLIKMYKNKKKKPKRNVENHKVIFLSDFYGYFLKN
jgi:tellurite resistance protein TehA-like permease